MLTANLLLPEEKKNVRLAERLLTVRFFSAGVAAVLGIGLVLLFPSYILLSAEKGNLEDAGVVETKLARQLKLEEGLSNAQQVAAMLTEVRAFLDRPPRASKLMSLFLGEFPGVRVEALSITGDGGVVLSGFAGTRDDLLGFQKKLQDSDMLEAITFPISDIIRSADIHFTMTGKLKKEAGIYF